MAPHISRPNGHRESSPFSRPGRSLQSAQPTAAPGIPRRITPFNGRGQSMQPAMSSVAARTARASSYLNARGQSLQPTLPSPSPSDRSNKRKLLEIVETPNEPDLGTSMLTTRHAPRPRYGQNDVFRLRSGGAQAGQPEGSSSPEHPVKGEEDDDPPIDPFEDPFADLPPYNHTEGDSYNDLDDDQKKIADLAAQGKRNICFVGKAGTGKSRLGKVIVDEYRKKALRVLVVAPSGTAALNVDGMTIHSCFGLGGEGNVGIDTLLQKMSQPVKERLRHAQVLVMDEASMVSSEMFERMDILMKGAKGNNRPMGGVQTIVLGDYYQLPSVKPFQFCIECGEQREKVPKDRRFPPRTTRWRCRNDPSHRVVDERDKWTFRSSRWAPMNFVHIKLTRNHRQQDPVLAGIIDHLAQGKSLTRAEPNTLKDHPCDVTGAVKLMALNEPVRKENANQLDALPGRVAKYTCQDNFKWEAALHPELADMGNRTYYGTLKHLDALEHPYQHEFLLKVGARVMLRRNVNTTKGLVNGALGTIISFRQFDTPHQPQDATLEGGFHRITRYEQVRKFMEMDQQHQYVPVVQFDKISEPVVVWPDCSIFERGYEEPRSLLMRTQIPLTLAWAMTIYKSQGATLTKAIVDVNKSWAGTAYVGISRVRAMYDMEVTGVGPEGISSTVEQEVKDWMWNEFGERTA